MELNLTGHLLRYVPKQGPANRGPSTEIAGGGESQPPSSNAVWRYEDVGKCVRDASRGEAAPDWYQWLERTPGGQTSHGAVAHIVTKDHGGKAFALAPRFPSREAAFDAVARFAQGSDLMQLVQDSYPDPTTPPHPSLTTPAPPVDLNSFTLGLNLPPVLQKIIPRPLEWMTKVIERSTLSMDIAVVEPLSSDPERRYGAVLSIVDNSGPTPTTPFSWFFRTGFSSKADTIAGVCLLALSDGFLLAIPLPVIFIPDIPHSDVLPPWDGGRRLMPLRNPGLHHMDLGPNGQEMLKECREVWNGWTTWIVFVEDEEEGYQDDDGLSSAYTIAFDIGAGPVSTSGYWFTGKRGQTLLDTTEDLALVVLADLARTPEFFARNSQVGDEMLPGPSRSRNDLMASRTTLDEDRKWSTGSAAWDRGWWSLLNSTLRKSNVGVQENKPVDPAGAVEILAGRFGARASFVDHVERPVEGISSGFGCTLVVQFGNLLPPLFCTASCGFSNAKDARAAVAYQAMYPGHLEEKLWTRRDQFAELGWSDAKMDYMEEQEDDVKQECQLHAIPGHKYSVQSPTDGELELGPYQCAVSLRLKKGRILYPTSSQHATKRGAICEALLLARTAGIMEDIDPYPIQYRTTSEESRQRAIGKVMEKLKDETSESEADSDEEAYGSAWLPFGEDSDAEL